MCASKAVSEPREYNSPKTPQFPTDIRAPNHSLDCDEEIQIQIQIQIQIPNKYNKANTSQYLTDNHTSGLSEIVTKEILLIHSVILSHFINADCSVQYSFLQTNSTPSSTALEEILDWILNNPFAEL